MMDPVPAVAVSAIVTLTRWAESDPTLRHRLQTLRALLTAQLDRAPDDGPGPNACEYIPFRIPYLPLKDAAARLGTQEDALRKLAQRGRFGTKVGRDWLASEADLAEYAANPPQRGRPKGVSEDRGASDPE